MTTYKVIKTKKGNRYLKNGKFTAPEEIREHILKQLSEQDEVTDNDRYCIFCDKPAKLTRLINMELVYICNEDYYAKTVGQIAQQLREDKEKSDA